MSGIWWLFSSSSSYISKFSSFAFPVVWFGSTIDVPHLLSMRLSNHLHFLASIGLLISATWRGQWECQGTTFPFALRIHWAISFPDTFLTKIPIAPCYCQMMGQTLKEEIKITQTNNPTKAGKYSLEDLFRASDNIPHHYPKF